LKSIKKIIRNYLAEYVASKSKSNSKKRSKLDLGSKLKKPPKRKIIQKN